MGKNRRLGVSRRVRSRVLVDPLSSVSGVGNSRASTSRLLGQQAIAREDRDIRERAELYLDDGLSNSQDEHQGPASADSTTECPTALEDVHMDIDDLPPALQQDEAFTHALRDLLGKSELEGQRVKRSARDWRERRTRDISNWDAVFSALVDAYCTWKYKIQSPSQHGTAASSSRTSESEPAHDAGACPFDYNISDAPQTYSYTFEAYDIFTLAKQITICRSADSRHPVVDMATSGYLGKTPVNPTVGISFKTLELLHRIRQRQPSFSMEAYMKVLCDYYSIPYRHYLRSVLSDAFEIYLRILREVRRKVFDALGWNTPNWRALNACRACCYKLDDEPDLIFSRLYAFDGNNSLKRMLPLGGRQAADLRVFDGDYFLPREFVDRFANEVQGSRKGPQLGGDSDDEWEDIDEGTEDADTGGDPTDGAVSADGIDGCIKHWKANASDDKKRMWSMFDESGVFMSACRHHLILWALDMVRSGELAKYPLAILDKILDTHEPKTGGAFDIGCGFNSTVNNSSLGPKFREKQARLFVNAFHGYSHNYKCQLKFHPSVIQGMGLEDLETMERIFSATNRLAPVTRYMTRYRRSLFIETYLQQWDDEKYANLGTFILNNFRQAIKVIKEEGYWLASEMRNRGITDAQINQWEEKQEAFFANIDKEPNYDVHAVAYVELLDELRTLNDVRRTADASFRDTIPANYVGTSSFTFVPQRLASATSTYDDQFSQTRQLETQRRQANARYNRVEYEVLKMEYMLGIAPEKRWTPCDSQYIAALKHIGERKYRKALVNLQRLVIQRLFELHKLNLSQTGYKMRTHIAKSLQTRCKAIRRAVNTYNKAAALLDPPRPPLDWSAISKMGFLEEFDLLKGTKNDTSDEEFGKPINREIIKKRQRVARAKEELLRCSVETRRLHTAIRDEARLFAQVLSTLKSTNPPLYGAVKDFTTYRRRVNTALLRRIQDIYALPEFDGPREAGERLGGLSPPANSDAEEEIALFADPDSEDDDSGSVADEEFCHDIGGLIQFSQLAL
ncbi:hypothetical protein EIP86_011125 [Pleurotus ostreatoroseus]|nr:hypothetical protein EIP86_011125 [Pleurotus ostreatoroseus]